MIQIVITFLILGFIAFYERFVYKITGWDTRGHLDRVNRWTGICQTRTGFYDIDEFEPCWEDTGFIADHYLLRFILDPLSYKVHRTNIAKEIDYDEYKEKGGRQT